MKTWLVSGRRTNGTKVALRIEADTPDEARDRVLAQEPDLRVLNYVYEIDSVTHRIVTQNSSGKDTPS